MFACTGCVTGAVFEFVTRPLDVNLNGPPVHKGYRGTSTKRLVIPYPFRMQFEWGSTAVADGMAKAGITKIYYADIQTLSVLGFWRQRWIYVYGE